MPFNPGATINIVFLEARAIVKVTDLYFRYKKAARPVFEASISACARRAGLCAGPSEPGNPPLALCSRVLSPADQGEFRGQIEVDGVLTAPAGPGNWPGGWDSPTRFRGPARLHPGGPGGGLRAGKPGAPREELRRGKRVFSPRRAGRLDDRDPGTLSAGRNSSCPGRGLGLW